MASDPPVGTENDRIEPTSVFAGAPDEVHRVEINKSIARHIYWAIVLLTSAAAVMTALGLWSSQKLTQSLQTVVEVNMEKSSTGFDIVHDMLIVSRAEKNLILARTNRVRKIQNKIIEDYLTAANEDIARFEKIADEQELELLNTLKEKWSAYLDSNQTVRKLVADKKQKRAFRISSGRGNKSLAEAEAIIEEINTRNTESTTMAKQAAAQLNKDITRIILLAAVLGVGGVLIFTIVQVRRQIVAPTKSLTKAMHALADGDTELDVPGLDRPDELGAMARAVGFFKQNLIENRSYVDKTAQDNLEKTNRASEMESMIGTFRNTIEEKLAALNGASQKLESVSAEMSTTSVSAGEKARDANSVAEKTAVDIESVVTAAHELSESIREITAQITQSSGVISQSVEEAESAQSTMTELAGASNKIGEVIALINDIAEQTNLLALNATIEAARAGDAGKGFAVVASEVKNLANQTAKATDEISEFVRTIQETTDASVKKVGGITQSIEKVEEYANAIAAAVEQQDASTREIARTVGSVKDAMVNLQTGIAEVSQATEKTEKGAQSVRDVSRSVSQQEQNILSDVSGFLNNITRS